MQCCTKHSRGNSLALYRQILVFRFGPNEDKKMDRLSVQCSASKAYSVYITLVDSAVQCDVQHCSCSVAWLDLGILGNFSAGFRN